MAAAASSASAHDATARIVRTEVGNDGTKVHTQYVIEAELGGMKYQLKRRYNE